MRFTNIHKKTLTKTIYSTLIRSERFIEQGKNINVHIISYLHALHTIYRAGNLFTMPSRWFTACFPLVGLTRNTRLAEPRQTRGRVHGKN